MPEWNNCDFFNLEQQILGLVKELKKSGYLREDYKFCTRQMIHEEFDNMMEAFVRETNAENSVKEKKQWKYI